MTDRPQTYLEKVKIDPANYCLLRGEYPHPACQVELYEGSGGIASIYGVCHAHRTYWHLQTGGSPSNDSPKLFELRHYTCIG